MNQIIIFYIGLSITFILFLFILFVLSKNDFMLLRKNISQVDLFNRSLLLVAGSIIFGRMFYILDKNMLSSFNPLKFLNFIEQPGVSLIGSFLGIFALSFLAYKDKKVIPKILDITFLSLTPFFVLNIFYIANLSVIFKAIVCSIVIGLFGFLLKFHKDYSLKDGSIFAVISIAICLTFFASELISKSNNLLSFSLLQLVSLICIIVSLGYLIKNEDVLKF